MAKRVPLHPMQPLVVDEKGVVRFRENKIVDWLFHTGKLDLNELAMMQENFDAADHMQIAQLLGYSVSGYGDLSYVTDESYTAAAEGVDTALAEYRKKRRKKS